MTVERGPREPSAPATDRPTGGPLIWRTQDVDRARALIAEVMHYPVTLRPLSEASRFAMNMRGMQLGPVNVNVVAYGPHTLIETGGLGAYHVNIVTTGGLIQAQRGAEFVHTPAGGQVPVIEPTGMATAELVDSAEVLSLGFERHAVENALEAYLDHSVQPLRFTGGFDPVAGQGRTLAGLARVLEREVRTPTGLFQQQAVASSLAEALLTTVLYATRHQYREELDRPAARTCPRPVKLAVEAMRADPAHPFTVRELARIAGVAPRSLQAGFQQHLDTTPMTYLRELRLECAHRDLVRLGTAATVTEVAVRWGFTHLGRFAAAYRTRYGRPPSRTHRN
ncbi:AraC family transcriptional regulator [Streptomyces sp. CA-132043]|uniref:AraC family transcriptional regulator n=1 Tax=Streptomyces sp. CA-132043 TaxID=3240048 RepID=UPI003D8DC97F